MPEICHICRNPILEHQERQSDLGEAVHSICTVHRYAKSLAGLLSKANKRLALTELAQASKEARAKMLRARAAWFAARSSEQNRLTLAEYENAKYEDEQAENAWLEAMKEQGHE
jgi:hypothetical protein